MCEDQWQPLEQGMAEMELSAVMEDRKWEGMLKPVLIDVPPHHPRRLGIIHTQIYHVVCVRVGRISSQQCTGESERCCACVQICSTSKTDAVCAHVNALEVFMWEQLSGHQERLEGERVTVTQIQEAEAPPARLYGQKTHVNAQLWSFLQYKSHFRMHTQTKLHPFKKTNVDGVATVSHG